MQTKEIARAKEILCKSYISKSEKTELLRILEEYEVQIQRSRDESIDPKSRRGAQLAAWILLKELWDYLEELCI